MKQWHNQEADTLSLDGTWQFSLQNQSGEITVPGCWEAQGYARRVEGPAVYERVISVPAAWQGRRIQLQFDAVSYHIEVEVNGVTVGEHRGSWSTFAFDVTDTLRPGEDNHFRLTVTKTGERFPMRESLAGFLPDVMLMFGGLWQSVRLVALDGPAASGITLAADATSGRVTVSASLQHCKVATVQIIAPDRRIVAQQQVNAADNQLHAILSVPEPQFWSPGEPNLYSAEILSDNLRVRREFGFRALTSEREKLLLNSEPVSVRGVLNWGWYPEILCPAPDEDEIRDEFRRVRELGFNMVKLCLYVPSARYFEIADEEGMLLWLELPMWLPEVTPRMREHAPGEYADIIGAVHHHPSIVIYSLGCELNAAADADLLGKLNAVVRPHTGGAMLCDNSGSGEAYGGLDFDFADFNDYHFYADLQYFEPLVDHFDRDWREPRPWIFGEFCDADDYRDLGRVAEAFGGDLPWYLTEWNPLHPKTFVGYPGQLERMALAKTGLSNSELEQVSYRQSFAIRKTILEKVRARKGMGGYMVTSIRETPLASSSMFDLLNQHKYDPASFRAFNDDTVLVIQRTKARRWLRGGDRPAPFEPYCFASSDRITYDIAISHTGPALRNGTLSWRVFDAEQNLLAGEARPVETAIVSGQPQTIGRLSLLAPDTPEPATLSLEITYAAEGVQPIRNSWKLWIFPRISEWPKDVALYDPAGKLAGLDDLATSVPRLDRPDTQPRVLLTSTLDESVREYLNQGGSVLLLQEGDRPLPAEEKPFWREGIKIIGRHPVMERFPHEGYADLQFYGLATDWALQTDNLAEALPEMTNLQPLLRRLDARHFGVTDYLIEAQVGKGRLIATTLRFHGGLGDQPLGLRANVAGRWLLHSLLQSLQP